jgi:CRP-like cAMP-binding protein
MSDATNTLLLRLASNVSLFAGMPRSLLERLLARSERVSRSENQLFFDEGEEGESFYVLLKGSATVEKKSGPHWVPLATVAPGDTFGEMTLIDEKVRSARVRATSDAVCLYFAGARLKDAPELLAGIYRNIARLQTRRLKAVNVEVVSFKAREMGSGGSSVEVDPLDDDEGLAEWKA